MRDTFGGIVVVAVVIGALSYFNSTKSGRAIADPVKLNHALVNKQKTTQLVQAYTAFMTQAYQAAAGQIGVAELRKSQDRVIAVQTEMQVEITALQVPDSKTARDFYQATLTMRTNQAALVKTAMAEIIQTVENPSLSVPARNARIQQLWQQVVAKEQVDLKAVHTAQEAFAREHNIRLLPNLSL
jgi:hypothetical protein